MSVEVVQHFLQAVAEGLQGGKILGWLQDNLLPYVARVLPQAMVCCLGFSCADNNGNNKTDNNHGLLTVLLMIIPMEKKSR